LYANFTFFFSFWGTSLRAPTGALSLDPTKGLPSPRSPCPLALWTGDGLYTTALSFPGNLLASANVKSYQSVYKDAGLARFLARVAFQSVRDSWRISLTMNSWLGSAFCRPSPSDRCISASTPPAAAAAAAAAAAISSLHRLPKQFAVGSAGAVAVVGCRRRLDL